jgi:hypothetical protein
MWENAEAAYRQNRKPILEATPAPSPEPENGSHAPKTKSQYSIDALWEMQMDKIKEHGTVSTENKSDFKQRMKEEYQELRKIKQADQEIVMTYDADERRCRLDLKDK